VLPQTCISCGAGTGRAGVTPSGDPSGGVMLPLTESGICCRDVDEGLWYSRRR
jgi:hypothetical protein